MSYVQPRYVILAVEEHMDVDTSKLRVGHISVPISPDMAARVAGRASKQKQTLTEAVDALLLLAFRGIDAASIAGKKRWQGITAEERSAFGRKAVESRWAKHRDSQGADKGGQDSA
jgi:hypothetical protein